jgi:hypothetical protein
VRSRRRSGRAESLRCNGGSSEVGDSRLSVLFKCGEPLLRDAYCAPVFYQGSLNPVPEPFASLAVPACRSTNGSTTAARAT